MGKLLEEAKDWRDWWKNWTIAADPGQVENPDPEKLSAAIEEVESETIQRDSEGENNDFTMTGPSAWIKVGDSLLYIVRHKHGAWMQIRRHGKTAQDEADGGEIYL